jgi:hypothetical protein
MSMTPQDREAVRRENMKVAAAMEILEQACDEILEVVYQYRPDDDPDAEDRRYDVLALLIAVYCRRAQAIGHDPQEMLEEFWPPDAIWVSDTPNPGFWS